MKNFRAIATAMLCCSAVPVHAQIPLNFGFGSHCNAQAITLPLNQEGRAIFTSDWSGIGDCRIGRTSSLRVAGSTMEFALLVKTDHTGGTDRFHVNYRLNTGATSTIIDGPGMGNGQPFQTWSGTTPLSGPTAGATSVTVGACC